MQTFNKESHKTPHAIGAKAKKVTRRGRGQPDNEEENFELEESEKQEMDKDKDENSVMIKTTKQEQVVGKEEEKQRTVSQQKRPQ